MRALSIEVSLTSFSNSQNNITYVQIDIDDADTLAMDVGHLQCPLQNQ
jgi:hypothetical protein